MDGIREVLRTLLIWEVNGWLVTLYLLWEHATLPVTLAAFYLLLRGAPREQRPWLGGAATLAAAAATFAPAPVPVLLSGMSATAALAVRFDRFNPHALRWRAVGGLALYAGAALAYLAYGRYLAAVDASAWARAVGEGSRRISLNGHNLPRYTRLGDLGKGKIGNTGRILKAEELVLAYDLDAYRWLALQVY